MPNIVLGEKYPTKAESLDLESELFEAAMATPEITRGSLSQFILKLYQWLEKLQDDNNITVDMISAYGTIHFQSICNPSRKMYYSSTISDCIQAVQKIQKYHGNVSIFLPDLYSICDDLSVLNNQFNKNKIKKLSERIIDIEWLDRDDRIINLEQVNIEYILGQIGSFLNFILVNLKKDYFDCEEILLVQKYIKRLRNLCIMFYKVIENDDLTKNWITTSFEFPEEIEGE